MKDGLKFGDQVDHFITREMDHEVKLRGRFHLQLFDKDGKLKWEKTLRNGITNVGKDLALNVMFHGTSAVSPWYIGLIDNSGYSAVAAGDTMGSHSGWNEFTNYDESTRVEWTEAAAASQSITSSSVSTFSINGNGTLRGVFITSVSTKSGTSGTLWSTALFASATAVSNGDSLKITYTVNAG